MLSVFAVSERHRQVFRRVPFAFKAPHSLVFPRLQVLGSAPVFVGKVSGGSHCRSEQGGKRKEADDAHASPAARGRLRRTAFVQQAPDTPFQL